MSRSRENTLVNPSVERLQNIHYKSSSTRTLLAWLSPIPLFKFYILNLNSLKDQIRQTHSNAAQAPTAPLHTPPHQHQHQHLITYFATHWQLVTLTSVPRSRAKPTHCLKKTRPLRVYRRNTTVFELPRRPVCWKKLTSFARVTTSTNIWNKLQVGLVGATRAYMRIIYDRVFFSVFALDRVDSDVLVMTCLS